MIKIQAHRGDSKGRPENTMSSFKSALELGADAIELDVYMLCDGSLVVHHDSVLGRVEYVEKSIYDFSKDDIKSFSIGEKFSSEYKKEVIPFFYEVLDFLKGNNLFLNVELEYSGGFVNNMVAEVVKLLEKYNMADRCIISSFDHYILKEIKKIAPKYKVGILYSDPYKYDIVKYVIENKFDAIHPFYQTIDKKLVEDCHKNGIIVNVWTVDLPQDLIKMRQYGVDSVISNDVVTAKKYLN